MQNTQEEALMESRRNSTNFVLGIFSGLISGIITEVVFKLLSDVNIIPSIYKKFYLSTIGISIVALLYIFHLYKRTNSINDYNEYHTIVKKLNSFFSWKEFYNSLQNSIEECMKEDKIKLIAVSQKPFFWQKYKRRFLISDLFFSNPIEIRFYENLNGKKDLCEMEMIIDNNTLGDKTKKSILKALKHEKDINHIEHNEEDFKFTNFVYRSFWIPFREIRGEEIIQEKKP